MYVCHTVKHITFVVRNFVLAFQALLQKLSTSVRVSASKQLMVCNLYNLHCVNMYIGTQQLTGIVSSTVKLKCNLIQAYHTSFVTFFTYYTCLYAHMYACQRMTNGVLNSRDWTEIVWLLEISHFKNQPCNRLYQSKNPLESIG